MRQLYPVRGLCASSWRIHTQTRVLRAAAHLSVLNSLAMLYVSRILVFPLDSAGMGFSVSHAFRASDKWYGVLLAVTVNVSVAAYVVAVSMLGEAHTPDDLTVLAAVLYPAALFVVYTTAETTVLHEAAATLALVACLCEHALLAAYYVCSPAYTRGVLLLAALAVAVSASYGAYKQTRATGAYNAFVATEHATFHVTCALNFLVFTSAARALSASLCVDG
jgi:hypothetical protein